MPIELRGALVGRDEELAHLEELLASGGLVTIVGQPGIGKTRLAREIAGRHPEAVIATLADVSDPGDADGLESALADGFGAPPMAAATIDSIRSMLAARRPTLLVLDDVDAARPLVRSVVEDLPTSFPVLMTARAPVGARGEVLVELGPLSTKPGDSLSDAARLIVEAYDELARHRPRRAGAAAGLDHAALELLAKSAEGVPLALELAAGAALSVGPTAALELLSREIQKAVRSNSPAARALGHAWDSLEDPSRAALGCLAVLAGPFDPPLAAATIDLPLPATMDRIVDLRSASLVYGSEGGDALEVSPIVREFVLGRIAPGAAHEARRRALSFLGSAASQPGNPPRDRITLAVAGAAADSEPLLVAGALLRLRLDARSLGLVERLLPALPPNLSAELLRHRGWALFVSGQSSAALGAAQAAMDAARVAGRADLIAANAINAVSFAVDSGRIDLAPAFLEEARALATNERAELAVKTSEAFLLDQQGRSDEAMAILSALSTPRERGELYRLIPASIATMRSYAAAAAGDIGTALHLSRMATAASSVEGRPVARYRLLEAILMHAAGDPGADILMREMIEELLVGEPRWAAAGLGHLAALEATSGQLERSTRTLSRALALGANMDSRAIRAALEWATLVVEVAGAPTTTRVFRASAPAAWQRVLEALFPKVLATQRRPSTPAPRSVLRVDVAGAYFVTPEGETVHLGRRHSLRRLLSAVASARQRPGQWVSIEDALQTAWPDDKSKVASLKNRLRVAIATLRKMGVGDALEGNRQGYRLDPSIAVEIVAA